MDKNTTFNYSYSAAQNKEVQEIRKKYIPREENKLDELKRLDHQVQNSGIMESLIVGIIGGLVFGLGLCMVLKAIGGGMFFGVCLGIVGFVGMLFAYPIYQKFYTKAKEKYAPRILELSAELTGESNSI